ncbi:hypothetical protein G9A89_016723 [Geosiphon pyriformis]|nr:hypothetical protein G9A89_016723 [Geosiphon pyriformis]
MKPVGFSANGSGSGSTGLEFQSVAKKKAHVESVYTQDPSYKKSKKPDITGIIVDLLAGPLSSHDSKMESKNTSINKVSDIKNMGNMVAEKTSYIDSNASKTDNMIDDTTSKKMQTKTYMLGQPPKKPSFKNLSDDDAELVLFDSKFAGSNWLSLTKSHALKRHSFEPVKSFVLNMDLAAFPGIIRSSFTFELSLKKTRKLAIYKKIVVNDDVRQINKHTNWKVIVKEIPVNLLKLAVESVFSKFDKVKILVEFKSADIASLVTSKWSVFMKKDLVHVVLVVDDKVSWILRDQYQALLYTLPVGTTAHDLSGLLKSYGKKTCFISHNPNSYVCDRCAVVCFENEASKLAAIGFVLVYKDVNLHWTGLFLACCTKYKQLGHISTVCSLGGNSGVHGKQVVTPQDQVHLANIYKKKQMPIVHSASFNGKTWAQIASSSLFYVVSLGFFGTGSFSSAKPVLLVSNSLGDSCLVDQLVSLECSLELLMDQVLAIIKKLSFVELVPLAFKSHVSPPVVLVPVVFNLNSEMALNNTLVSPPPSLSVVVTDSVADLSSNSSRVLTTKVGGLESKIVALEMSVKSVLERLDHLCSGLR